MKFYFLCRRLSSSTVLLGLGFFIASVAIAASSSIIRSDGHSVTVDPAIASYNPRPPLSGDLHLVGGGGIGTDVEGLMAGSLIIWMRVIGKNLVGGAQFSAPFRWGISVVTAVQL